MFWPEADRALLAAGLLIFCNLFFAFFLVLGSFLPGLSEFSSMPDFRTLFLYATGSALFWSGFGWWVKTRFCLRDPGATLPGILLIYIACFSLMVFAYFNGVHSFTSGALLAVFLAFAFVLFQTNHVLVVMVLAWLQLTVITLGVSFGWWPDAPLFADQPALRALSPVWALVQVAIGFSATVLMLLFIRQLVGALRESERQVRALSRIDPLTGLWNRGYLDELTMRGIHNAIRNRRPVSMLVVDLDHFKKINDEHGHSLGDQALIAAAHAVQASVREVDFVARFGGEEFVVLLPDCDTPEAKQVAERCRDAVARLEIVGENGPVPLTASIGIATAWPPFINADDLFRRADRSLYLAKEGGRNRVVAGTEAQGSDVP